MKNKGFTLIELLAVIVILAIIALIATPMVLNVINDAKMESAQRSMENYIHAVELAIANKNLDLKSKNLDGKYYIKDKGKILVSENNSIEVEFEGQDLTVDEESFIVIEDEKVKKLKNTKIDKWYAYMVLGKLKLFDRLPESRLLQGNYFNDEIKQLVNDESYDVWKADEKIISIEFLSWGQLPENKTKEELYGLPNVNLTDKNDNNGKKTSAYYEKEKGKVYVYSEDLIVFDENSKYMFMNFKSLTNIEFGEIDTSNVEIMSYMFRDCNNLKELDLKSFDTSKVTTMSWMFGSHTGMNLINLDLSSFDTGNVMNMNSMFYGCGALKSLEVSNFDTRKVEQFGGMFAGVNIPKLDLISFDTKRANDVTNMFAYTDKLKSILVGENWNLNREGITGIESMFAGSGALGVTRK